MNLTSSTTVPQERLNPLNDYLFLKVMGEKGDEVQLLGFLNAVLGRTGNDPLVSVEILENRILSPEFLGDKASILDVRAILQDGTKANIEVQLRNLRNMDKRSLFYWSREYTTAIKKGQDYLDLPNVVAINIIDFEFLETKKFHTVFHLREDEETSLVLTNALEIHFLDMVKWRKQSKKDLVNEPLHRWLTWLDRGSPPELIAEVVNMDIAIMTANGKHIHVMSDENAVQTYEMRQKAIRDLNSMVGYAHDEGKTEGRTESILEVARKMKAMGFSADKIQAITGLDVDKITTL